MSEHITTYTGKHFFPLTPDPDLIDIEDIAHALPLITRGNGHVKTFFSVGQHCVNCAKEAVARNYPTRVALACLLHDASECYMSDVPSPFKKELPQYIAAEDHLLDLIYTKYLGSSLTEEEFELLDAIDKDMLYFDLKELLGETMPVPEPKVHIEISYAFRPFAEVEDEYRNMFELLTSEL